MSKTLAEVAEKVLKKLGRLADGQVAPASQKKSVTDEYDGLYDELLNDGLVNWAKADSIPDFAYNPICILLLGRVADDFGVPDKWSARETQQRKKISAQISSPYVSATTPFEDY